MSFYTWGRSLEDAFDERKRTRLSSIIFRRSTVDEKKRVVFEPVPDEVSAAAKSNDSGDDSVTEGPIELTKTLTKHTPNEIRYAEVHGQHSRQERPTISVDEDLCAFAL
jgi:acetylglutamate synthase